jgi:hypothetical protein
MIWQENVNHIIMITSPNEKFVYYWPKLKGDLVYFDDIRVSLKEICNDKFYIHRTLQVQRNGKSRQVDFAHIKISWKVVPNCYLWTKGIMRMFMSSEGDQFITFSHSFEVARGYRHCYGGGGSSSPGRSARGGRSAKGAKRHGTMEPTRGHRASRSDDGDELERSDEGWLDDGASAGTPC